MYGLINCKNKGLYKEEGAKLKIQNLSKIFESITMPLFIYGADINVIHETCDQLFQNHNISERIQLELESISEIKTLINFLNSTPIYSNRKMILLKNAQKWSKNVKSALLKSLEEYPQYNQIIITSTSILDLTIMSRCYKFHIQNTSDTDKISIESITIQNIMSISDPTVLFLFVKQHLYKVIENHNIQLLAYVENLWDKVNETYGWFRKGEIASQNCIQIMSNLILDHLNQINNL
ncbi:hypothetical protein [Candidatus Cytomitobacter primus]|uniref:Uncharacterized protein n=1 Tax=Candidatus Cytomitobacter primus TaxID=2066024 RepID=A0A5C0UF90_9PROT|nr:hypothetical protein [Candidatus Cytomitobacter primus]QEK38380.1 hypothetical protein FZC34_00370 [Candidatus Cytomitobacter primus]